MSVSRLKWQCRRGMRELDALMVSFLENDYAQVSESEKKAFEELLELPDPMLVGYLLKGEQAESPDIQLVVDRILGRALS